MLYIHTYTNMITIYVCVEILMFTPKIRQTTFCLFSEVTVVHLEVQATTAQVADPLRVFPPSSRGPPKSTPPTAAKGSSQGQQHIIDNTRWLNEPSQLEN